jgi:tetratricopeptide (TPR) repeat protein
MLFEALIATGAPPEAAEEAHRRARRLPGGVDEDDRLVVLWSIYGDFDRAVRLAGELEQQEEAQSDEGRRWFLTGTRVRALIEAGQIPQARAELERFLRRRPALTGGDDTNERNQLHLAVRLGLAPRSQLEALVRRRGESRPAGTATDRWVRETVFDDPTVEEARQAVRSAPVDELERRDLNEPIDGVRGGFYEYVHTLLQVGVTLQRGGQPARAVRWLRAGLRPCMVSFVDPFVRLRGALALGRALEAQGDRAGARAAYQEVLRYWGAARPGSATADEARKRLAAL